MTEDQGAVLLRTARGLAYPILRSCRSEYLLDDAASFAVHAKLRVPKSHIENSIIDYLRSNGPSDRLGRLRWDRAGGPGLIEGKDVTISFEAQSIATVEVQHLLSQLKPRYAQVLRLYYLNGFTLKEVAKLLHVTECRVWQIRLAALAECRAKCGA